MSGISEIYAEAVYHNLKPLRANWSPDQPVALGDYGELRGQIFVKLGNVADLGVDIGQSASYTSSDQKIFTSGDNVSLAYKMRADGEVAGATANARLEISLASARSVFFNAAACRYEIIRDKPGVGAQIEALHRAAPKRWDRRWVVVTDVVFTERFTAAVTQQGGGAFSLEAAADVPKIDLAKGDMNLSVSAYKNVGFQMCSQQPLAVLLGLAKIQPKFLDWNGEFKPLTNSMLQDKAKLSAIVDDESIPTEAPEALAFSQLD